MPSLQARAARTAWPLAAAPDGWRIAAAAQPLPSPTEPSMTNDETPTDAQGAQDAGAEAGSADARVRNLPVQLAFDLGRPQVIVSNLASLQPGHALALPTPLQGHTPTAWPLAAAPYGWRIAAAAQPLPSPPEPSMTNDETPNDAEGAQDAGAEAGSGDALVRNLPVQRAFDIGRLEVSVGDLASLQPGYVFALPAQLQGANVTIRANGRTAGRGEVVAVGDTIGVRLLSWE